MSAMDTNTNSSYSPLPMQSRVTKPRVLQSASCRSTFSLSKSTSFQSGNADPTPMLIQLCTSSDEACASQTMRALFSSHGRYSASVCDEFGCNVLMYALRYKRYQLFHLLLNETSLDIDLHSKDRQGNTILHYAVVYARDDATIIDNLIEKFNKFGIDVDVRNLFGFTPLLLAAYCGRYDLMLVLLNRTDASPFVRDYIRLANALDYIEVDSRRNDLDNTRQESCQYSRHSSSDRDLTRLRIQMYNSLPRRSETVRPTIKHQLHVNFFEHVFPQAIQDRSGAVRSFLLDMLGHKHSSSDLTSLIQYVGQRYPRINTPRVQIYSRRKTPIAANVLQRENSKTCVHKMFNLFDPGLRPKAIVAKALPTGPLQHSKGPNTFKRLGTKLTVLAALSRSQICHKSSDSTKATTSK